MGLEPLTSPCKRWTSPENVGNPAQSGIRGGDKFSVYQDPEAVFSDLAAGRIDAVIDSVGATTAWFESQPIKDAKIVPLQPDSRIAVTAHPGQLNWPTKLDNSELTKALNENIEELRKDGTIAELLKKYGMDPSAADVGEPGMLIVNFASVDGYPSPPAC